MRVFDAENALTWAYLRPLQCKLSHCAVNGTATAVQHSGRVLYESYERSIIQFSD